MKWVWRIIGVLLVIVLVAGVLAAGFGWWTVRRPWPQASGTISVPGLTAPVEVLRDERGIADIYADTVDDLFFASGYVHAQDRFFEMDVRRHTTAGRLAEMFGEDLVETDVFVRTMGWRRVAEQEYPLLSPDSRRVLEAYAAGVNAYLAEKPASQIALEYQILALQNPDYTIESWNPIDSLAWLKALAWQLRSNMDAELQRVLGAAEVGTERISQLFPPYPQQRNGTILSNAALAAAGLPTGDPVPAAAVAVLEPAAIERFRETALRAAALQTVFAPTGEGIGSNSWVVSGGLTASGQPLLANDPHLGPSLPSLWYQVGLHCRTVDDACPYDVSGWSMAGMPGIVIGHNARLAWGLTNMGPDVMDLVLEQVVDGESYLVDGRPRPLAIREERIAIAGGTWQDITVRSTEHGPIVSDPADADDFQSTGSLAPVPAPGQAQPRQVPERGSGYAVALRWTALEPAPTFDALLLINTARSWDEFRQAARLFAVPAQNLVYADRDGNIGYQAPGNIPVRARYDGKWPVPGWDSRYDWTQFIPFAELPRSLNPPEGFIIAANQRVVPAGYPWPVQTDEKSFGARALRINDRLAEAIAAGPLTGAQMAEIQLDAGNDLATFLVPRLAEVDGLSDGTAQAVASLADWDYRQTEASSQAAFFNVFYRALLDRLFQDELPELELRDAAGDRFWEVIRRLWERPDDLWWDDVRTEQIEQRDQTVVAALEAGYAELTGEQGTDPDGWRWGDLHTLTFTHQTLGSSDIRALEIVFNRGPEPTAGGSAVPLATGWIPDEGYQVTWVPSMRQVIDMADYDSSTWVNLTGNSGHPYHPNYGDQIRAWLAGEQYPWAYTRAAVEAAAVDTLTLTP
jgi:penicillin amidase